jgi:hypothetical protein
MPASPGTTQGTALAPCPETMLKAYTPIVCAFHTGSQRVHRFPEHPGFAHTFTIYMHERKHGLQVCAPFQVHTWDTGSHVHRMSTYVYMHSCLYECVHITPAGVCMKHRPTCAHSHTMCVYTEQGS